MSVNGHAKLTADDVLAIRAAAAAGETNLAIARRLGVSRSMVSRVATGRTWSHVGGPTRPPRRQRQWARKLTVKQAAEIRRRFLAGESSGTLGREFGVNAATALRIGGGKMWRQLAEEPSHAAAIEPVDDEHSACTVQLELWEM